MSRSPRLGRTATCSGVGDVGIEVIRTTRWEEGVLVAEVELPSGGKMTSRYELEFEGQLLAVTSILEGGRFGEGQELRRLYDRQPL